VTAGTGRNSQIRLQNQPCSVSRCSFTASCLCREELMAEVPEMENAYVKVPKIM